MNMPKMVVTHCPRCNAHTSQTVSLFKEGKRRALAKGERHHKREMKGYGGQKYPLLKRKAKTTKKQTLKFKCRKCGYTKHKKGIRLRRMIIK
jgi:large subunit ribosomal protein L44e